LQRPRAPAPGRRLDPVSCSTKPTASGRARNWTSAHRSP